MIKKPVVVKREVKLCIHVTNTAKKANSVRSC